MSEPVILLVGGNSEIGNALVRGISRRKSIPRTIIVSRGLSRDSVDDKYYLASYDDLSIKELAVNHDVRAIVIAFGILESDNNLTTDLRNNFDVNTFQYLNVVEKSLDFIAKNKDVELHVTSSVLADFSRDSVFAYSLSKESMEKGFKYLVRLKNMKKTRIYIWKLAYVATNLNKTRTKSKIFTTLESIEKSSAATEKPGSYYLPKSARFPSKILNHLPELAAKLD